MSLSTAYACSGTHCVTCSDEGAPMTVVIVDERRDLALCADAAGKRHTVEIALLASDEASVGARVLVHAGVAIAALGAEAA